MFDHLDDPQGFTAGPDFRKEVKQRGRRIQVRRRLTAVVATALVSASALTAVLAAAYDPGPDEDSIVITPSPTVLPPAVLTPGYVEADPSILVTETVGALTVTPSTVMRDGDALTLHLEPPLPGDLYINICAAEADQHRNPDPTATNPWCGPLTRETASSEVSIEATRILQTPDGLVDCAEAPGRCAVAVSVGSKADTRYAPLTFEKPEHAGGPRIEVFGLRDTLTEGDELHLVGTGFGSGDQVDIAQCRADITMTEVCGEMGRGERAAADDLGRFEMTFTVFTEIGGWPLAGMAGIGEWQVAQWSACDPCLLRVRAGPHRMATPLEMTDTPSTRPRLEIAADGPLVPGGRVRLEGEGFQPGFSSGLAMGWCPPGEPATAGPEMSQGHASDLAPETPYGGCVPQRDIAITVTGDGRFVIDDFPLPAADTVILGRTCAAAPGACTIAIVPRPLLAIPWSEGSVPLDLSG